MNIDLGPIIYAIIATYASVAILVLAALSVGTWGIVRHVKQLRLRQSHFKEDRSEAAPHYQQHPQAAT